jgi:hypothetical protein
MTNRKTFEESTKRFKAARDNLRKALRSNVNVRAAKAEFVIANDAYQKALVQLSNEKRTDCSSSELRNAFDKLSSLL